MDNFISKLNPNELVVSLYHPKLYHLYQKFGKILDKLVYPNFDVNTKKLYDHLSDIDKGLSLDGFKLKCESLGFSDDMNKFLTETYSRYCGLEDDDYKALFYRIRNFVLNEAIKDSVNQYNADHEADKFIEKISSYQISDLNNNFNDEKLFTSCDFDEIDVEEVKEDYVQGVIKSSLPIINEATTLGGYMRGQMVVFGAPTKTGKSMISMQEAVNFVDQGLNVVYSAFGDLKKYDFLYRMSSQINHRPLPFTELNLPSEVASAKNKVKGLTDGHLNIQLLAPDKFTASDYVDYMKNSYAKDGKTKLHDWADVIIVDYDANLKSDKSMYLKGEDIYQTLYQLVYPNKLLIVLAQTNKFSWGKEVIGLGDLGESSRKQQIIDILLTISHPVSYNVQNHVGWMNLCAGRRVSLMKCPYFRDVDGTFHEISSDTYGLIKSSSELKTFIKDIQLYNNYLTGNYTVMKDSGSVEYSESQSDDNVLDESSGS